MCIRFICNDVSVSINRHVTILQLPISRHHLYVNVCHIYLQSNVINLYKYQDGSYIYCAIRCTTSMSGFLSIGHFCIVIYTLIWHEHSCTVSLMDDIYRNDSYSNSKFIHIFQQLSIMVQMCTTMLVTTVFEFPQYIFMKSPGIYMG